MKAYKLKYSDKETALKDLKKRGYNDADYFVRIVHVGKIVDVKGTYDDEGNTITEPTFIEGHHVDVYSYRDDLEFAGELQTPNNPRHRVKGWETNEL